MDIVVKNEKMDKPVLSINTKTIETNNLNYQISDRNKFQENIETIEKEKEEKEENEEKEKVEKEEKDEKEEKETEEKEKVKEEKEENKENKEKEKEETNEKVKEKEEKDSCCLINIIKYIYSNFLESRQVSPFALIIFTVISVLINIILFISSLIYASIDLNPKTPYFYELMNNWRTGPFKMNIITDTNIITNPEWYKFKRWEGTNFKFSNFNTNYFLILNNSIRKKGRKCGKDSIGNDLFFEENE